MEWKADSLEYIATAHAPSEHQHLDFLSGGRLWHFLRRTKIQVLGETISATPGELPGWEFHARQAAKTYFKYVNYLEDRNICSTDYDRGKPQSFRFSPGQQRLAPLGHLSPNDSGLGTIFITQYPQIKQAQSGRNFCIPQNITEIFPKFKQPTAVDTVLKIDIRAVMTLEDNVLPMRYQRMRFLMEKITERESTQFRTFHSEADPKQKQCKWKHQGTRYPTQRWDSLLQESLEKIGRQRCHAS